MAYLQTVTGRFFFNEHTGLWEPRLDISRPAKDCEIFVLEHLKPNRDGISGWIDIEELAVLRPSCAGQLGGNGSNMFSRGIARDFLFTPTPDSQQKNRRGKIIKRRSVGLVKERAEQFPINRRIKTTILNMPCAVLGTKAQIECDHKDGRKNDPSVNDVNLQQLDDFQPLHKTCNGVKREACNACQRNNQRFDATTLGFPVGWIHGDAQYHGTCRGCYWYDPRAFYNALSFIPQQHS